MKEETRAHASGLTIGYEADKHAKKELKKHLRGVRPIERAVEHRNDEEAEAIRGYCLAVRSALTAMLSTFRKVTMSYWSGLFHCKERLPP